MTDLTAALARALAHVYGESDEPDWPTPGDVQAALAADGIVLVNRERLAAALRPALDLLYQPPEMVGGDHALAIAAALLAELEK